MQVKLRQAGIWLNRIAARPGWIRSEMLELVVQHASYISFTGTFTEVIS